MSDQADRAGHRARLRLRFLADPQSLSQIQLLELLLTFAIPRQDVAPLAKLLLEHYGNVGRLLAAPYDDLIKLPGVGEQVAIFFKAIAQLTETPSNETDWVPETAWRLTKEEIDGPKPNRPIQTPFP